MESVYSLLIAFVQRNLPAAEGISQVKMHAPQWPCVDAAAP
jgi:hypothetical protein